MGTYLSSPVLEKGEESGETLICPVSPLAWGVVDMQGWRKSMEDGHVAALDVDIPEHLDPKDDALGCAKQSAKVFGVFDGHGGPEVARFTQLYIVDVLTSMNTWTNNVEDEQDPVGQALIATFHALDRMVDHPERREELIRLRMENTSPGERRTANLTLPNGFYKTMNPPVGAHLLQPSNGTTVASDDTPESSEDSTGKQTKLEPNDWIEHEKECNEDDNDYAVASDNECDENDDTDLDSQQTVGHEEAGDLDSIDDSIDNEHDEIDQLMTDNGNEETSPEDINHDQAIIQQLLSSGHGVISFIRDPTDGLVEITLSKDEHDHGDEYHDASLSTQKEQESAETADAKFDSGKLTVTQPTSSGPSASIPTLPHNGRQVCTLPDHPIHAGCTATVAVLIGRTLTIANAGDSRGVLCREGGHTEPLSYDHKPMHEVEINRITNAGGFVNQFGRVNGNLNLSRCIGDLKYKQTAGLSPAQQMITAEPDIIQITLQPNDEFFVLGCDGIWDCLTNEQAVKYVRDRIDTKTPTEIGVEMLDTIISEDPRATQGIGGDNMTIMVVDLQPLKRSYR